MKEKITIIFGVGIICLVSITAAFYFNNIDIFNVSDMITILAIIVLIAGSMYLMRDRLRNLRLGLPSSDERMKKLHWKAGAYSYYATIWIAVGAMWYNIIFAENMGYPELTSGQIVGVIVLLSGMIWFALQLYFMRSGDA
ncbi:MAG: hypothetical protein JW700_02965 [Candidatus Aenigmarchaeota archaeon]|nr:hypothetical protein [Candidatus Aenigmarchaeota archaeon]